MKTIALCLASAVLLLACDRTAPPAPAAPTAGAVASEDAELAALQALTPVDACARISLEDLQQLYPQVPFVVQQALAPRLSGYVWDSRCVYVAGQGSVEGAPDAVTQTVAVYVATAATPAAAQSALQSRHALAQASTGYQALPALGAEAYAITQTGAVSIYFVREQSEVQINVTALSSPNAQKLEQALALAALY